MADPTTRRDPGQPAEPAPAGAPRWVKVFGIVVIAVVLFAVVLALAGGGHGPGRHLPGGDAGAEAPADGHVPPEGGHG
jgi:hypothetical protein